ncbi:MAG: hypothetical protein J0M18_09075 [Ignavibacteria bacterium]|nr:hypothetical protein [Ignavibacteria bacterium]
MNKLYSYCIPYDNGSAPNPYWDVCTLVICKPGIRRVAKVNDWIVATGSKNARVIGDISDSIVYAMKVTKKMSMKKYFEHCNKELKNKIPDISNSDFRRRRGDCIYDFSESDTKPKQLPGVHDEGNYKNDLNGENALLSDHFYYFGSEPVEMPEEFKEIIHNHPNFKSDANQKYFEDFVNWIETTHKDKKNKVTCIPGMLLGKNIDAEEFKNCAKCRKKSAEEDEEEFKKGKC